MSAATTPTVPALDAPPAAAADSGTQEPIISHIRLTETEATDGNRTAEDVLRDFARLHSAGNYEGAALVARELIAVAPDHPEGYYNLACALARMRQSAQAFDALNASVERGCRWIEHLRIDPDLDSLRGDAQFAMLLAHVEQLIAEEAPADAPVRTDNSTAVIADLETHIPALLSRYHVPGASIYFIDAGAVAWHSEFGRGEQAEQSDSSFGTRICLFRRPVDLLALVAAAQQEQAGNLNLASLLGQADEIGLRDLPGRQLRSKPSSNSSTSNATLVKLTTPSTLQLDSDVARRIDWTGDDAIPGTVELIALGVELTSDTSFAAYCANNIFEPAAAMQSELVNYRRVRAKAKAANADAAGGTYIVGHTRLGTPIADRPQPDGLHLKTTPADLALMIASLLDPDTSLGNSSLERIAASAKLSPGGLGLGIDINRTTSGPRFQLAESANGIGLLARWYPQTGRGVVIVFNSENGPDAAIRIAQIALGGS